MSVAEVHHAREAVRERRRKSRADVRVHLLAEVRKPSGRNRFSVGWITPDVRCMAAPTMRHILFSGVPQSASLARGLIVLQRVQHDAIDGEVARLQPAIAHMANGAMHQM